jgi:hypothetical protein
MRRARILRNIPLELIRAPFKGAQKIGGTAVNNVEARAASAPLEGYRGPERRRHLRLEFSFPARVQGIDGRGDPFEVDVNVENICAGGFYLLLPRRVGPGAKLSTTIRFSTVTVAHARPKFLAAHGTVRRADHGPDGTCGVGVEFEHHLFL